MSDPKTQLCAVLAQAASHDEAERRAGEGVLAEWEKSPMFHMTLQDIYFDRSLDTRLRSLAIIHLKNGITKYWHKTAKPSIVPDEKAHIRQRQIAVFDEPLRKLAIQQAIVTSKIARADFPNDWPNLISTLFPIVQASFAAPPPLDEATKSTQYNSLYTLHHVVKAMCSKVLPASRRELYNNAPAIFSFVSGLFYDRANAFLELAARIRVDDPQSGLDEILTLARVALKCLRRLIVQGFPDFDKNEGVTTFTLRLLDYLQSFMKIRSTIPKASSGIYATLSSISILVGKLYIDLLQERVVNFVLSPHGITILRFYWTLLESTPAVDDDETSEKIVLQGLKLLKLVVKNPSFNTLKSDSGAGRMPLVVQTLDSQLFMPDSVMGLFRLLVTHYIRLSREDLATWEDDPESFAQEEETDQWEFSIKACAERVLMDLVAKNRDMLCPVLVRLIGEVSVPTTQENVLFKDAVMAAAGLAAHDLYDLFDFAQWAMSHLVHEAQRKEPWHKIMRRRISWLIGRWISVKAPANIRPALYETVMSLMMRGEDLVVRLTAVSDLRRCVDDFDFVPEDFLRFLEPCVPLFMQLLEDTDEFESKMRILGCLLVIIERMEGKLWERAESENMFRASIVSIMTKLMKSLRGDSAQLHGLVLPILEQSVDTSKPGHLYLIEEGLELWLVTVQNAPAATPELVALVPYATHLITFGSENLKRVLHIVEAYVVLDPLAVLQANAMPIMSTIAGMLGELRAEASNALMRTVDTIVQACHAANCFGAISQVISSSSLFAKMLSLVLQRGEINLVVVGFLAILARIAIYDPVTFIGAIDHVGATSNPPVADVLGPLLDLWVEKFDAMGHGKQRKLTALAMANLLGTGHPAVLARLNGVFGVLTSVAAEIAGLDKEESTVFAYEPRDMDDDEDSLDKTRWEALQERDPVLVNDSLAHFLRTNMAELERKLGGSVQLQQALAATDPDLLLQMQHFTR
nr:Importin-11 [Polyrhizophydium stewartii]